MKRIYKAVFDDDSADFLMIQATSFEHACKKAKTEENRRNERGLKDASKGGYKHTNVEIDKVEFVHLFK